VSNYTFESLSPNEFEVLCRDLLQEELDVRLESFRTGRDGGIDLRYAGDRAGELIVQCKHFAASGVAKLKEHLRRLELPKVQRLSPKRYIIATSVALTPHDKAAIQAIFNPYCKGSEDIFGRDDLNNLLGRFPVIERAHFKLWLTSTTVLERVLHSEVYNQTKVELENIQRKARLYVPNRSFAVARSMLDQHGFVVIAGIPGIGKTTLAEMLIYDFVGNGFQPFRVYRSAEEAFKVLNPSEKQVFYFDDFLGPTTFDSATMGKNEDQRLLSLLRHAEGSNGQTKVILTTRDYIFRQARLELDSLRHAMHKGRQCVIDLQSYTRMNRAEILCNHLYFSNLPQSALDDVIRDENYRKIVDHPNYSPRIIEWMTTLREGFRVEGESFIETFFNILDHPRELWRAAFERHISVAGQHLLIVLASLGELVFVDELRTAYESFHTLASQEQGVATRPHDLPSALEELENTFIAIGQVRTEIQPHIRFQNPSVRDFLEAYIGDTRRTAVQLCRSAVSFDQLRWLWGKHRIGGLASGKPFAIPLRTREALLENGQAFAAALDRLVLKDSVRLAPRLLFVTEALRTGAGSIPQFRERYLEMNLALLAERMKSGDESFRELYRLAHQLRQDAFALQVKEFGKRHLARIHDFGLWLEFCARFPHLITASDNDAVQARFEKVFPNLSWNDLEAVLTKEDYDISLEAWDVGLEDEEGEDDWGEFKDTDTAMSELFRGMARFNAER